jgi:hypothetical protein
VRASLAETGTESGNVSDMNNAPKSRDESHGSLKRRDRRVVLLEEFTDQETALIASADVSAEHLHLDEELKDWCP